MAKSGFKRFLRMAILGGLGVIVGFVVVGYFMVTLSESPTSGTIPLDKLEDSVSITFDAKGIPQIWARNDRDGYFALGFQHAADRLFQMELIRRVAQGRLSETLGSQMLELDKQQRLMGHTTKFALGQLSMTEATASRLQAYSDGVNAYIDHCSALPFEFLFLPTEIEPWTPRDCFTCLSFQTWFSNALLNQDEMIKDLHEVVGPERLEELTPLYPDWAPVSVPPSHSSSVLPDGGSPEYGSYPPGPSGFGLHPVPWSMSNGSNAWAVGPGKSQSGKAMLAADPHLEISRLPQFWYGAGLHIEESGTNVLGVSVPGLPFFVMGHNGQAAWAFTVGGVDVLDYSLEKIDPNDSTKYCYLDKRFDIDQRVDTFYVNGADPVIDTVRNTRNGFIVGDPIDDSLFYVLFWQGYEDDMGTAANAAFRLHDVSNFADFRNIVTQFGSLDAAWIYADSSGDIGYQLGTRLSLEPGHRSKVPLRNWTVENDWLRERLPGNQNPHAHNPEQGWLASCNNMSTRGRHIPGKYSWARIGRISHLLDSAETMSVDDLRRMQSDLVDTDMLRWARWMAQSLERWGMAKEATELMAWRGSTDTASVAPNLASAFKTEAIYLWYRGELGALTDGLSSLPLDNLISAAETGQVDSLTAQLLRQTLDSAAGLAVDEVSGRTMGTVQSLTMRHPMAMIPLLTDLLELEHGPWPWGGSNNTLNAAFTFPNQDGTRRVVVGPSWRFTIDFADVDGASFVLPAGNSGNPISPHFFDFFETWREGETWTVPLTRAKVEAAAKSTLTLVPNSP